MRVLVTGGAGFLGSHICEAFARRGWEVVAYDILTKHELARAGFGGEQVRSHNTDVLAALGVELRVADIRDLQALCDAATGVDFLVHTAAQPAMTISVEDIPLDFTTNVVGTYHVLEAARRHRVPVACCSTIHVYGPWINDELGEAETRFVRDPVALDESARTMDAGRSGKLSPLHASKAAGEHYVRVYADTYGVAAASFRYTGIYGPRQFGGEDHGWVAHFAISSALGRSINIFGSGKQVRDILYATDAAAAFTAYAERPVPGVYNIGGGPESMLSLIECIRLIDRLSGRQSRVTHGPERDGDLRYFVSDTTRARDLLRWEPTVRPAEGIGQLLTWIDDNRTLFVVEP